jgi:gliding motility-associated-like protein
MRMPFLYCLLLCGLMNFSLHAQQQPAVNWSFGYHAGINFAGNTSMPFSTAIETHSAMSATQSDNQGNVLFYANGYRIWDAAGNLMPNSVNPVWPNGSQGGYNLNALIIPDAANANRYFVFHIFASKGILPFGPYYTGQLTYSVVDMSLNGGMGDVVAGMNHILLDTCAGHYATIVPGSRCNYWVVVQNGQYVKYDFRCYEVNAAGVNTTPVVSKIDKVPSLFPGKTNVSVGNRDGQFIYSYTRHKIIASYESADITAYDFDPLTGMVTNPNTMTWAYPIIPGKYISSTTTPAICLSPDESLLYISGYSSTTNGYMLRQLPLTMNGNTLTTGAPYLVYNTTAGDDLGAQQSVPFFWQRSAIQLGLDGSIYHTFVLGQNFVGKIVNPNVAGAGCNFQPHALQLQPGTYTTAALPSPTFTRKNVEGLAGEVMDTTICFQKALQLTAPAASLQNHVWQNGQTGMNFNATASGVYTVKSTDENCHERVDSFKLNIVNFETDLGDDISTCFTTILQPLKDIPANALYRWHNGSADKQFNATRPGKYWLAISVDGCTATDTISMVTEDLNLHLPVDTTICEGVVFRMTPAANGASYIWQDGTATAYYDVKGKGLYSVIATKGYCIDSAAVKIEQEYCDNCLLAVPTAFTPNNDGKNDFFKPLIYAICPVEGYHLRVCNRFGVQIYNTSQPLQGWDGTFNGTPQEVGAYFYYLKFTGPQGKKYFYKGDVTLVR